MLEELFLDITDENFGEIHCSCILEIIEEL